jgi:hypothetical protein
MQPQEAALTPISERRYNLRTARSLTESVGEKMRPKGWMMAMFSKSWVGSLTAAIAATYLLGAPIALAQSAEDAPAVAAPVSEAPDVERDGIELRRELRTVEEDVSHLKERVFRSKATLKLLKELVVEGVATGSRVVVWHINQLGGGYSMESAQYFLDGKNVFSKVDPGGTLDTVREIKVHEQTLPPGQHTLQGNYVLRGQGYKIFSYLRSYQFKVQSSYSFEVADGKPSIVRVVADSRGGLRNFVERPTVLYDERNETIRED